MTLLRVIVMTEKDIEIGDIVVDSVSKYQGMVVRIGEHISGCTRIGVRARSNDKTERSSEEFFFPKQLEVRDYEPVEIDHKDIDIDIELGERVRDKVTGFEGYAVVINRRLYNVPQVRLETDVGEGNSTETKWIDLPMAEVIGEGVSKECEDLTENDNEYETGCTVDKPSSESRSF